LRPALFLFPLFALGLIEGKQNAFEPLFDGKSLRGWEGSQEYFRVELGSIVAGRLDRKIPKNQFLVTQNDWMDFELTLEARIIGIGQNAGVQFWSQRVENSNEMIGYQCDIGFFKGGSLWGWLYDESRRNCFLAKTSQSQMEKWINPVNNWNHLRVQAVGNQIGIWINHHQSVNYSETEKVPQSGKFGLQVHSGPPMEAWYRKLLIRHL
jgi:hypothetical protein